jgi:peptidyl-prolyl cis-trans isomerase D
MGLGNYQSASDSYAFKINDQVITTSQLEQEVFQYRQALESNTQGSLPPFYTNKFIRNITMDYMLRTIILDNTAKDLGLVYHNESILDQIYNTSSFRDESGFNKDIYKSQLYRIGMSPQSYEGYVHQKGISEQLKKAITSTSIITTQEKTDLIKFRHHTRNVNYKVIKFDDIKKSLSISEKDKKAFYEMNKSSYMSPALAKFEYIDIDKNDIIKDVSITDEVIKNIYDRNLATGEYNKPSTFKINHLLVKDITDSSKDKIIKARDDITSGLSFEKAVELYSNDEETITNKGYLGEFISSDLPVYLSSQLKNLKTGDLSEIIESDKGYHLMMIVDKTLGKPSSMDDVRDAIKTDYKKEMGTREYFDLIDEVNERNFTRKYSLSELSSDLNLSLLNTKYISKVDGHGIFNFDYVRDQVFTDEVIKNNQTSELIYINDDRFIVAQLLSYEAPVQMSYEDSKDIIEALMLNQQSESLIKTTAESFRDDMNAGISEIDSSFEKFSGTMDSESIDSSLKEIFFATSSETGFLSSNLNKDYLIYNISNIVYPDDIKKIDNADDYYNFILNTRSESEFNMFYNNVSSNLDIIINSEYMGRD